MLTLCRGFRPSTPGINYQRVFDSFLDELQLVGELMTRGKSKVLSQGLGGLAWSKGGLVSARLGPGGPVWRVSDDTFLTARLSSAGVPLLGQTP